MIQESLHSIDVFLRQIVKQKFQRDTKAKLITDEWRQICMTGGGEENDETWRGGRGGKGEPPTAATPVRRL